MSYLEYNTKSVPVGLRKLLYLNWPLILLLIAVACAGFLMLYSVGALCLTEALINSIKHGRHLSTECFHCSRSNALHGTHRVAPKVLEDDVHTARQHEPFAHSLAHAREAEAACNFSLLVDLLQQLRGDVLRRPSVAALDRCLGHMDELRAPTPFSPAKFCCFIRFSMGN